MKKNIAKLSMLLVLVALLASCFSISALAAGSGESSEGGILGVVGGVYDWFAENFTPVFRYVYGVVPVLGDIESEVVHYAILGAALLLCAVILVLLVVSLFKGRFFRALARLVMWCALIWAISYTSLLVRATIELISAGESFSFEAFCSFFHAGMLLLMPNLYELAAKIPALVSLDLIWLLPLVFYVALILIIVVCAIIIKSSKKRARRKAAARAAAAADAEAAALAAAPELEALEAAPEIETAPAAESEASSDEQAELESAETAEAVEEAPAENVSPLDDYPKLDTPVFMPIPSSVFDVVDFTDPARDGYALTTGVAALDASYGMSDDLAEELTAVVYAGAKGGEIVKIGVDCLCANFKPYSYVNVNILRRLGLIPESASAIMVVDHGTVDKPLMVEAAEFSTAAVKLLTLAGGRAVRLA